MSKEQAKGSHRCQDRALSLNRLGDKKPRLLVGSPCPLSKSTMEDACVFNTTPLTLHQKTLLSYLGPAEGLGMRK